MQEQIETALHCLRRFQAQADLGQSPPVDRAEVVAHATLSAWAHHWPKQASPAVLELLATSVRIKNAERSRWMVQRRIAIAKLARLWQARERAPEPTL